LDTSRKAWDQLAELFRQHIHSEDDAGSSGHFYSNISESMQICMHECRSFCQHELISRGAFSEKFSVATSLQKA
jgi:hypothetical protein